MSILYSNRVGRVCAPMTVDFLTRDVPSPKAGEAVIKIAASAVCGSDLHIFKGKHPSVQLPATIGHEFSGDVVAIGGGVSNVAVGDRVTVEPCIVCGTCDACRRGTYGYCENISFTYRMGDGAMADYITVKADCVYALPEDMDYEQGALIEPLSVATHAVRRAAIEMGESVLVVGGGAIGLLVAALCRKAGAAQVIVTDYSDGKLAIARDMGATYTINPADGGDVLKTVAELTDGKGVDKSFECVGLEATFRQAMMSLRKNGLATVLGIFENPEISIPATRFITHEIRVQGSQGYCWDFPIALKMAREIDLRRLITHRFPMEQLQQALDTYFDRNANSVKIILKP